MWPNISQGQYFQLADQNRFNSLQEAFEINHVQYKTLADSIDRRFRKKLIENLDPSAKYFLSDDVVSLHTLLDQHKVLDWDQSAILMDSCYIRLKNRLFKTYRFLESLKTVDFTKRDTIHLVPFTSQPTYFENERKFEDSWLRNLKYAALMSSLGDTARQANPGAYLENLEAGWKVQVENSICEIKNLLTEKGRLKEVVFDAYLNAFAQCFDPHSNYFSIQENEIFNSSLNTEIYTPGIFIEPNYKDYYVSEIIPNSDASKVSNLHTGDKIVCVSVDGSFLSPSCLSEQKMYDLFYGKSDSTITMKVLCPKDRISRTYTFSKELTTNAYNKSLSFKLATDNLLVGYIMLPSFYMNQGGYGDSSGQDLAAILMQLKDLEADALILDLRGNGGGSLSEAVDLAGFFTDFGPLFLARDQYSPKPVLLKDTKKGRLSDKKLILMVNQFSASAAELVANTLQTYPNVIVVGTSTFGKSSGQDIIPLLDNEEVFGYAKVTSLEIFRFDGKTIQGVGAIPDVYIPSGLPSGLGSEATQDYSLTFIQPNKHISPVFRRQEPLETLQLLSAKRLTSNQSLIKLKALEEQFTFAFSHPLDLSLNYKEFKWPLEDLPDITDTTHYFRAQAQTLLLQDSLVQAYQIKQLEEDPMINEAMRIMADWLSLN
ncbi:MAG: S41 family peptidase [Marinoscillum sp.]